jgi:purine-binding chemotaxis protein CheW
VFGIEVGRIQGVLRYQDMTPVPLAPPAVQGLINLRGQIVAAVDLRRRLGLRERAPDQRPVNVVVRSDHDVISLLVDEMGEVVEVGEESFELPPETMDSNSRRCAVRSQPMPRWRSWENRARRSVKWSK